MMEDKKFTVQAIWPTKRIVQAAGCKTIDVFAGSSLVLVKGDHVVRGEFDEVLGNTFRVTGEGAGEWSVHFALHSDSFGAVPELALSVFEPGERDWNVAPLPTSTPTPVSVMAVHLSAVNETFAVSEPLELAGCVDYYRRTT